MHEFHADLTGLVIIIIIVGAIVRDWQNRKVNERSEIRHHELEMERAKQLAQFLTEKEYTKMLKDIDKAIPPVANEVKKDQAK